MPSGQFEKAHRPHASRRKSVKGLTLLEVALCIAILAILSVGVSSLVKTGVETQLAQRVHQDMQAIGMNIVDDLRQDIRTADRATVAGGGNTLTLDMPTGTQIVYQLSGANAFTRWEQATGATKLYNDPNVFTVPLQVQCPAGCFEALMPNNDAVPSPRQIFVRTLSVAQVLPAGNAGTMIDQSFGPANFTLREFSFDVMSATEFQ